MYLTRTNWLRIIRIGIASLLAILIVAYAISRSLNYARGPKIDIFQPLDGSAIASSTVMIVGRAERINSLSMNGQTVFVDEMGNFTETVIVFKGMNTLTFDAKDQFGREVKKELDLVGVF